MENYVKFVLKRSAVCEEDCFFLFFFAPENC